MHARVAIYQCLPEGLDQALAIMSESVAPVMRGQTGFQNILLFADAKNSRVMSISIWESEDAMRAGEASGGYFQEAMIRLAPHFIGSPVIEHYDVTAQG